MKDDNELDNYIEENFILLSYREKYNLPLYDKRYMNLSGLEMHFDLVSINKYKKKVKQIVDPQEEDDDNFEEIEDTNDVSKNKDGSKMKLKAGFTKDEIDEFWNKDLENV